MAGPRIFPRAVGWRRVLLVTSAAGASALLVSTGAALLISGAAAAASAALGGGGVIAFCVLSLALLDGAERRAPHLSMPLFMVGFVIKVAALAILLTFVEPGQWLHPGWTLGSAVVILLVWQTAEILSFTTMRLHLGTAGPLNDS